MRGSNRPSLQDPLDGDNNYEVGGGYLKNSRYYDYNNGGHPDSPSAYSQLTTATRRDEEGEEDPDAPIIIRVIAPATLEEGYTLDVLYDDEQHTVEIPPGGVREGEEFETVIDPKRKYHDQYNAIWYDKNGVPHGTWRNRLFGCCDVLTQSTFWMGLFCTPVLMAQLITRLGLTWNGREGPPEETYLSYNRIILGLVFVMGLYWIPVFGTICVFIYYLVVVVYVGSHVRGYMRKKYQIPSTLPARCCSRVDDTCMMFFCGCCSSIQMARHTHDDKDYPGHACTTTGLEYDAPSIV
eukprot:jgi/Psemu1/294605/fgenesh1_pm.24_\